MAITIEAVYENGVLKPSQPLPFKEHEKVRLTVEPELSWAARTAGMLHWTGEPEDLRRLAEDDEFGIMESHRDDIRSDSSRRQRLPRRQLARLPLHFRPQVRTGLYEAGPAT